MVALSSAAEASASVLASLNLNLWFVHLLQQLLWIRPEREKKQMVQKCSVGLIMKKIKEEQKKKESNLDPSN